MLVLAHGLTHQYLSLRKNQEAEHPRRGRAFLDGLPCAVKIVAVIQITRALPQVTANIVGVAQSKSPLSISTSTVSMTH